MRLTDPARPDRRRFLQLAAAATTSAGLLAACTDDEEDTASEDASDVETLNGFRVVQLGELALFSGIAPLLDGSAKAAVERFAALSEQQAAGLVTPIADLGGEAVELSGAQEAAQRKLVASTRDRDDALSVALKTKNAAVTTYFDAVPKLFNDDLRATAGQLVVASAEQAAVLVGLQTGNDPRAQAPDAFVG